VPSRNNPGTTSSPRAPGTCDPGCEEVAGFVFIDPGTGVLTPGCVISSVVLGISTTGIRPACGRHDVRALRVGMLSGLEFRPTTARAPLRLGRGSAACRPAARSERGASAFR